jgi:type VI secretion system FHA domain protein
MYLTLQVTSAQGQAMGGGGSHTFGPDGGTIGRRSDCSWILSGDPYVSSTHASITARGGDYYVTDSSSNGTGINARDRLLPKDQPIKLNEGDVLFIGDFEIRVGYSAEAPEPLDMFAPAGGQPDPFGAQADPFGGGAHTDPFDTGPFGPSTSTQTNVPPVADLVSPDQPVDPLELLGETSKAPAIPDPGAASNHSPAQSDYFRPPQVVPGPASSPPPPAGGNQLPDDWDVTSFSGGSSSPQPDSQYADPFAPAEPPPHIPEPPPQIPQPGANIPPPAVQPPQPPPQQAPVQPPQQAPVQPPQPEAPPPQPAAAPPTGGADLSEVLRGAGLDPGLVSPELAREFGQILSVVVAGMIDVLKARTEIKSQFRVPVTTIKPVENNPLKFSAGVEDALHNLLAKKGTGYLGPVEAFEEGFEDIKAHQMATLAGMRAAFSHMLSRFDPEELEAIFAGKTKRGSLIGVSSKIKYWEQYKSHYKAICDEAEDNFQRLFGEAFAQAYEEQMQRLTALARNKAR